nr:MAPEG family protein [Deltaproteobacteria bacterium]
MNIELKMLAWTVVLGLLQLAVGSSLSVHQRGLAWEPPGGAPRAPTSERGPQQPNTKPQAKRDRNPNEAATKTRKRSAVRTQPRGSRRPKGTRQRRGGRPRRRRTGTQKKGGTPRRPRPGQHQHTRRQQPKRAGPHAARQPQTTSGTSATRRLVRGALSSPARAARPACAGPTPKLSPVASRIDRALRNLLETFPFFAAAALAVVASHRTDAGTALGAQLYFGARLIYVGLYAAGIPYARTLVWTASMVGIVKVLWPLL